MAIFSEVAGDTATTGIAGTPSSSGAASAAANAFQNPEITRTLSAPKSFSETEFSNSWLLLLIEGFALVVWSIVTGIAYHRLALGITGDIEVFAATGVLVALIFCCSERLFRSHRRIAAHRNLGPIFRMAVLWLSSFLILSFFSFSFKISEEFSRGAILVYFFTGLPIAFLARKAAARLLSKRLYNNSLRWSDAVIVGCSQRALDETRDGFRERGCAAPCIVEIDISDTIDAWPSELERSVRQAAGLAHKAGPGAIYVCAQGFPENRLNMLLTELQMIPRAVRIIPDAMTARLLAFPIRGSEGGLSVEIQGAPLNAIDLAFKRAFDLLGAALLSMLLLPLLAAIALVIKLDSGGPVFFRQTRLGHHGRAFRIFKFRTMRVLEDGENIAQARIGDDRTTGVGRFLRKSSLDELPQLINVIRGEMSLVGPRPHAAAHDKLYAGVIRNYELRQHVKPGITGWAQVHGFRGATDSPVLMWRRVELDIWYAKNASMTLDVEILLRTISVILGQKNAY